MEVGCNVFLTHENVGEFDSVISDLLEHGVAQFAVEVASYLPTARSRRYEAQRPTLADLEPLLERVQELPGPFFHDEQWRHLDACTERSYVRQALEKSWPSSMKPAWEGLYLVCRPNLDLYWGVAGRYRRRYGNLRRDDAQRILQAAVLHDGERSEDALWFDLDPIPQMCALAKQYGDPAGQHIHLEAESLRRRWLDLAQQAQRTDARL
jgi:MoaA/NifB/PqqE/SkfB family radical SAM enzyme